MPPAASLARFPVASRFAAIAVLLSLALLGSTVAVLSPDAGAIGVSATVDAPSPYEGQITCTKSPQPGTVALATWLMKTYRVTGSMGMMRACSSGGRSEHKDGRAFDWKADVRRKATRRAAYDFIRKALATDDQGNAHALARRMGIMYIIYNDKIWSSYYDFRPRTYLNASCKRIRKCSRTLRHLDHVHISLGYAGAAAQTSWYRSRGIPSLPVLYPGTDELNPDETAVTPLTVPADGTVTSSTFSLRAGVTYRIVATGTTPYEPGQPVGDANCSAAADGSGPAPTPRGTPVTPVPLPGLTTGWNTAGSRHPASPYAAPTTDTHGLLVNGSLRWEGGCQTDHTYEAWFRPDTKQRLQLQYADAVPGDDTGSFTVYVARDDILRSSLVG
ncbi:MAG TPA: hypothetical protein VHO29_16130 [Marmoricola sp.]|nr:hypothetical protein [Marmoricola sp.]